MSQHIPSTTPPTPPTDKLYLSDEETLAITVSPGVLWNYSQQHFVNPPKAFLQVTGSHLVEDGCEQKSTTDFDIWIDCSEKSELEWIQIKDSTGSSVTYNGSAAITSELDSPLGQWYRQYTNNLSQQRGFIVIKEFSQHDKATISAHIKLLADRVAYGGTLTTKFHDLGLQINVPSTEPSLTFHQKPEVKSFWNIKWPFTDDQNASEEILYANHLQTAMVNRLKGWLTLGDPPLQMGMSPLRRGIRMGNREVVSSRTVPKTGNSTWSTVRFSKWGCDEISASFNQAEDTADSQ